MHRVSVIIPGRCERYFQQTIDSALERAVGDVEVIAVVDGYEPNPPLVARDARVKIIRLDKSIGQRAAYNLGVRESSGEYVMKIDAHALMSPGYDEVLKAHCPEQTTVLPEMRRLDVQAWQPKRGCGTWFMFFGLDLYCHYWQDYRRRPEARAEYPEVLTGQGSCWFMRREWNDYIGLLDEKVGSWGNVGIEVSLRTWLCGGTQIVNRKAWQAHWFRVSDGGFPYPMDGRQVARAHKYTWEHYYFQDHAFEHQVRPFAWLLHKFQPVPTWEAYLADGYQGKRAILYYTDSQLDESLAGAVRKNLREVAGPIPIYSVSQTPLDFGTNICVGPLPRSAQSMYRQILAGAERIPAGYAVYLCEHDVFYHPSHFTRIPQDERAFYFNQNRYYLHTDQDTYWPDGPKSRALSQAVVTREYLIEHCKQRLANWTPRAKMRWHVWESERPNVDIRHDNNLTGDGPGKSAYVHGEAKGVTNIGGWGSVSHFRSKVGYKGLSRADIVQRLIDHQRYRSYLEIGTRKGETFNAIRCALKHGVDPVAGAATHVMTSDAFFAQLPAEARYDLVFIDGLHEAEQVKRDIGNALAHLADGGSIVMHDCAPRDELEQRVPMRAGQRIWTGDVWRAFVHYRRCPGLEMFTVNTNNGVGVIRRGRQASLVLDDPSYADFASNRAAWLNLKSTREFQAWLNAQRRDG